MSHCVQCGHELGVGRFCVNCGRPVDQPPAPPPVPAPMPPPAVPPSSARRRTSPRWEWILGGAVLVMAVVVVVAFLVGRSNAPDDSRNGSGAVDAGHRRAHDLTRQLEVAAPQPAPPNQDVDGNLVRYVEANLLDGEPDTCWRTPGDATGETITLTLPRTTEITEVGLINGYAKEATDGGTTLDWYHGNRRIAAVEWVFDDGTTMRQDLDEVTTMQTLDVDRVVTDTITLRLLAVTPPGTGRASRDYTAISDLAVSGS